ncbi:P1 family peptidase [Nonomuraea africana]|uniref:Pantetheine hydrolase n=1 Tax=Nonomuraea africana TaxID=46171 RepID=A0ABR9KBM7_9ACTN|nr:P1 family peptidase [Nonomuraea africana]MBE1559413.1 putative pantetheine hydrolase [Nonomuraea africana]
MRRGATNSLADVEGLRVGHAQRVGDGYRTGVSVVLAPPGGAVAGVDVRGAAPGTRETELLDPRNLVERVHAIVLTGGSAYGLSAACGVMARLADAGTGFPVAGGVVPIVPSAVIYDLGRGGAFRATPDAAMGAAAYDAAIAPAGGPPGLAQAGSVGFSPDGAGPGHAANGSVGAGTGAVAGGLAGGVGTASAVLPSGITVAALAVVNAAGSVLDPGSGLLSGTRYGLPGEFDHIVEPDAGEYERWRPEKAPSFNTTIGVVATDLTLSKAQCGKLAGVAHDGLARAIRPAHTMVDGDTIFALSTCGLPGPEDTDLHDVLAAAADVFSRAVAHAVLHATGRAGAPAYLDVFSSARSGR